MTNLLHRYPYKCLAPNNITFKEEKTAIPRVTHFAAVPGELLFLAFCRKVSWRHQFHELFHLMVTATPIRRNCTVSADASIQELQRFLFLFTCHVFFEVHQTFALLRYPDVCCDDECLCESPSASAQWPLSCLPLFLSDHATPRSVTLVKIISFNGHCSAVGTDKVIPLAVK